MQKKISYIERRFKLGLVIFRECTDLRDARTPLLTHSSCCVQFSLEHSFAERLLMIHVSVYMPSVGIRLC